MRQYQKLPQKSTAIIIPEVDVAFTYSIISYIILLLSPINLPGMYAVWAGDIKLHITAFSLLAMADDIILKSTFSNDIGLQPLIESTPSCDCDCDGTLLTNYNSL